jgi:hypothetical protein
MSVLRSDILEGVSRLALVGVAKNCGKTTTLNYLLSCGVCDDRIVGLVSIGIDGESTDLLIGTKKPPIQVGVGQWVVTARDALAKSSARIEYVASLGFSTPLGEVVVGRVIAPGTIVLAGMRHRQDIEDASALLEANGVDLVIIDGAYGRTVAARAEISDAIIVSTGAVLSDDSEEICERTCALVRRLAIDPVESGWQRDLVETAIDQDRCLLGGPDVSPVELARSSALLGLKDAGARFTDQILGVAVPGLVSDTVIEALLGVPQICVNEHVHKTERVLLVPDGTVLQASAGLSSRLERTWRVCGLAPARVIGVSINPSGIQGHQIDAESLRDLLLDRLAQRWPKISIFNPLHSNATPA